MSVYQITTYMTYYILPFCFAHSSCSNLIITARFFIKKGVIFISGKKNKSRKSYTYAQRKAYWQGVGFGMASGHTATEQARFIKKMRTSKILDSFQAGTLKDKH